jgi:hypothetical protein
MATANVSILMDRLENSRIVGAFRPKKAADYTTETLLVARQEI